MSRGQGLHLMCKYQLSFARTRQIGIGVLLGLIILRSVVSFFVSRYTMNRIDKAHSVQQVKRDHFDAIAFLFTSAAANFYTQDLYENFQIPIKQIDHIQAHLDALNKIELTALEKKGVQTLRRQHERLRVAVSGLMTIGIHEMETILAATRAEMGHMVFNAIQQAMKLRAQADVSIAAFKRDAALSLTSLILTLGTILTVLTGICVSALLTWALSRHVDRITRAIREIGRGNLAYRIHSPFTDEMGQLATGIDEMAAQLEISKRQLQETSEALTEARLLSDRVIAF